MTSDLWARIALVLLFILISALFVAAEIALVSLRDTQVQQLAGRGKRGRALHGSWNVIGVPHASHIGATDSSIRTYALCRTNNHDVLAMLRIPLHSRSVSVLDALLPR